MRLPFLHAFRLGFLAIILVPVVSHAVNVKPGEGVYYDGDQEPLQLPAGEKLAEKVLDFTLRFPVPDGFSSNPLSTATGTISSSVYRDTDSDGLIFLYKVEVVDAIDYTDELSDLVVGLFAGFTTDVTGRAESHNAFGLRRSDDGSTLTSWQPNEGLGSPPTLLIETDATAFDDRGTASYHAAGEFAVFRDGEGDFTALEATVSFSALYQPIVPEPSMASLLAAAAVGLLLHRRA